MMALLKLIDVQGWLGLAIVLPLAALLGLQAHKTALAHHETATVQAQLNAAQTTIINYQQAAEKARQADLTNAQRVKAEQAAINERTSNEYEARLAAARARAASLRQQLEAAAHSGRSPDAGVSRPGTATGSPDGAAAEDGFSVDDRLLATEQAIQLDELEKWVRANVGVNYGGETK